jgi:hypothetical protein
MSQTNPYKAFVRAYLFRGAMGVSVGLAAVAAVSPDAQGSVTPDQPVVPSFAERLSKVRSAVSECLQEQELLRVVQLPIPHPPPPLPRPFANFGKAPLEK